MASLIDFLTGTKETDTSQQTAQQTSSQKKTEGTKTSSTFGNQDTTETARTTGSKTGTQTGTTQLLDAETLGVLRSLIPGLASGVSGSMGLGPNIDLEKNLSAFITERAKGTDAFTADLAKSAETAARANFAKTVLPQIAAKGNAIGSNQNTYSAELVSNANAELEAQVGGIVSNILMQGRQLGSSDLLQAFGIESQVGSDASKAGQADIANLSNIVSLIRGSNITTSQQSQESTVQDIARQLETLTGQTGSEDVSSIEDLFQNVNATTDQETRQNATILDFMNTFAKFGGGRRT